MTTECYDIGDNRRFTVMFTDIDGAPADPTNIEAVIKQPDGVDVAYEFGVDTELAKDDVGIYHIDFTFTQLGRHKVRFEGTGNVTSAQQIDVYIRA